MLRSSLGSILEEKDSLGCGIVGCITGILRYIQRAQFLWMFRRPLSCIHDV